MREIQLDNKYWLSTVCIDSYDGDVPKGSIDNPFFDAPQRFESLTQFIRIMECTLDLTKQPQSFTNRRQFDPTPEHIFSGSPQASERGKLATFSLCIRFRQNTSWQGQFNWLEMGRRSNFRSVLELILLMDSALQSARRRNESGAASTA